MLQAITPCERNTVAEEAEAKHVPAVERAAVPSSGKLRQGCVRFYA